MIFSLHKNFIIAVCLFVRDPELHSGTERSSFFDKFRIPGPEPSILSVNLAGSGPVMVFINNPISRSSCAIGIGYRHNLHKCIKSVNFSLNNVFSGCKTFSLFIINYKF